MQPLKLCFVLSLFFVSTQTLAFKVELLASGDKVLARPHDLVLDKQGKRLYVTDMENDRIAVLHPETLKLLFTFGDSELAKPHDIAFDERGRILVADTGNDRIAIYEISGDKMKRIGEYTDKLSWTEGVATTVEGTVYATNVGDGSAVKLVQGKAQVHIIGADENAGRFVRPHDIHVWKDKVYVADPGRNRIQIFDRELQPLRKLEADFKEPKYMEVDPRGWLYVADQHNNVIKVFDENDKLILAFGKEELNLPEGVEVRGDRIWVSDTYNDRVLLYKLSQ